MDDEGLRMWMAGAAGTALMLALLLLFLAYEAGKRDGWSDGRQWCADRFHETVLPESQPPPEDPEPVVQPSLDARLRQAEHRIDVLQRKAVDALRRFEQHEEWIMECPAWDRPRSEGGAR